MQQSSSDLHRKCGGGRGAGGAVGSQVRPSTVDNVDNQRRVDAFWPAAIIIAGYADTYFLHSVALSWLVQKKYFYW